MEESADSLLESLKGGTIQDGGLTDEGLHICLEDGRVIIFSGTFVIGVVRPENTLQ